MEIHLSPDQEAHLAALAASVGRPVDQLVQEALAEWEQRQAERQPQRPKHTPAEAAARILELRKGNIFPAGETIENLINYGRACPLFSIIPSRCDGVSRARRIPMPTAS